jgi:hypothetical protein
VDSDDHITAVLFAHPDSLDYLQSYPDTLLLDCTYKTNKYKMPLLEIIGVDACQRSFCIAFAFLSGETEADYSWVSSQIKEMYIIYNIRLPSIILTDCCLACINTIEATFPSPSSKHLLCLWHANKAVVRYYQPTFNDDEAWRLFFNSWHQIIQSPNEDSYEKRVSFKESTYHGNLLKWIISLILGLFIRPSW